MAMTSQLPPLREGELVYVVWKDSSYSLLADRWQDIDDVKSVKDDIGYLETVGLLIDENEEYITLAQTVHRLQNQVRGGFVILKKNIIFRADIQKATVKERREKE